jgi:hypothetical protein
VTGAGGEGSRLLSVRRRGGGGAAVCGWEREAWGE